MTRPGCRPPASRRWAVLQAVLWEGLAGSSALAEGPWGSPGRSFSVTGGRWDAGGGPAFSLKEVISS